MHFKKPDAQAKLNQIKENFASYANSKAMRPYKEAYEAKDRNATSAELELNTADGLLAGLTSFRNTLKKTDPIWLATNSGNFKAMKDRLSEAIQALKDFKKTPASDMADAVKEKMEELHTAVKMYHDVKERQNDQSDRGLARLEITEKFEEYLAGKVEIDFQKELAAENPTAKFAAQVKIVHDMSVGLAQKQIEWNDPKMIKTIADAYDTMKRFPDYITPMQHKAFAWEVGSLNWSSSQQNGKSILFDPALADIRKELIALSKEGDRLVREELAKKANAPKDKNAEVKAKEKDDLIGPGMNHGNG